MSLEYWNTEAFNLVDSIKVEFLFCYTSFCISVLAFVASHSYTFSNSIQQKSCYLIATAFTYSSI